MMKSSESQEKDRRSALFAPRTEQGKANYPEADEISILCDGGGSNSSSAYLFKEDLQSLFQSGSRHDPKQPTSPRHRCPNWLKNNPG
jgi:hypothetical protein